MNPCPSIEALIVMSDSQLKIALSALTNVQLSQAITTYNARTNPKPRHNAWMLNPQIPRRPPTINNILKIYLG